MPVGQPLTETVQALEAAQQFQRILYQVSHQEARVIVEEGGVAVAAVISAADLSRLESYDHERAERFKVIDQMRTAFKDVDPWEIEREVATAIAEVRAEQRTEPSKR